MDAELGQLPASGWLSMVGMMTIPRELTLQDGKLIQNPVRELEDYRKNRCTYHDYKLTAEEERVALPDLNGRGMDLSVTLCQIRGQSFYIYLAADETYETAIRYEKEKGNLILDRTRCGVRRDVVTVRNISIEKEDREHLQFRLLSLRKRQTTFYIPSGKR